MRLQPERTHPHGLSDTDFDALLTNERRRYIDATPENRNWTWGATRRLPAENSIHRSEGGEPV